MDEMQNLGVVNLLVDGWLIEIWEAWIKHAFLFGMVWLPKRRKVWSHWWKESLLSHEELNPLWNKTTSFLTWLHISGRLVLANKCWQKWDKFWAAFWKERTWVIKSPKQPPSRIKKSIGRPNFVSILLHKANSPVLSWNSRYGQVFFWRAGWTLEEAGRSQTISRDSQ